MLIAVAAVVAAAVEAAPVQDTVVSQVAAWQAHCLQLHPKPEGAKGAAVVKDLEACIPASVAMYHTKIQVGVSAFQE